MSNKTKTTTKPATAMTTSPKAKESKPSFWSKTGDSAKDLGKATARVAVAHVGTATLAAAGAAGATVGVFAGIHLSNRLFGAK
jgi:hypothetical protein